MCNIEGHVAVLCKTKRSNSRDESYIKKPRFSNVRAIHDEMVNEEPIQNNDEYICVIGGIILTVVMELMLTLLEKMIGLCSSNHG